MNQEIKSLLLESLRESQDSYAIKELFEKFPITTELITATEQQLQSVKGIGRSKARQITAMFKLAKTLTYPKMSNDAIRSPKDIYNLLEPEFRFEQKEHFICLYLIPRTA
ncbi:Mov34/MPN/PAD-1 family protein [Paenibacillus sp. BAC0078]